MCERYRRDLQPANDVEQTLIDEICFNYWRLQQARVTCPPSPSTSGIPLATNAATIKRSTNSNRRSASANRKQPASLDFVPQNRNRPRQFVPKPRVRQLRLRHKMSPEPPSSLRTN
jgi:hypothetical protein